MITAVAPALACFRPTSIECVRERLPTGDYDKRLISSTRVSASTQTIRCCMSFVRWSFSLARISNSRQQPSIRCWPSARVELDDHERTIWRHQTLYTAVAGAGGYAQQNPDDSGSRFLLAYHYMIGGHKDAVLKQLTHVVRLTPSDRVASELLRMVSPPRSERVGPQSAPRIRGARRGAGHRSSLTG